MCRWCFPLVANSDIILGRVFKKSWKLYKNNGTLFTVKYLKECRLHVTRWYTSSPMKVSPLKISLDKEGFPTIFSDLKSLLTGTLQERKFAFTVIGLSRVLRPDRKENIPYSLESITAPKQGDMDLLDPFILEMVHNDLMSSLSITPKPDWSLGKLPLVTKAGPNGPQTMTVLSTIRRFGYHMLDSLAGFGGQELFNWFLALYKASHSEKFVNLESAFPDWSPRRTESPRRLSIVKDPECKMRVIAIFDYASQVFLDKVAKMLFEILGKIPSDRTFTQDPYFTHSNGLLKDHKLWSIDLTSATDRFPMSVQVQILSLLIGEDKALHWKDLMVGHPFATPDGSQELYYSVGQPMGAKSSWPMFTLAHHYLVKYCASSIGLHNFNNYIILGDDIVINHDDVAKCYMETIARLGVDLSPSKTHVSLTTYEFAKRWIDTTKGEVTGLPMRGIIDNIRNPFIVFQILFDYYHIKGNLPSYQHSLVLTVAEIMRALSLHKISQKGKILGVKRLMWRLEPFSVFMRFRFGLITYDELRKFFAVNVRSEEYMIGPQWKVILEEFSRVLSLGLTGMAWSSVKRISGIYQQIKMNPTKWGYQDLMIEENVPLPIIQAIFDNVDTLTEMSMMLQLQEITLEKAMDVLLLIDIDSISSLERRKVLHMAMIGKLAQRVRTEIRFDPNQVQPRARSMQVIAALRNLHLQLRRELGMIPG